MVKQVKPNTVYDSSRDGDGARVTREFVTALFYQLGAELASAESLAFFAATRIPNERELYGTFVKALLNCVNSEVRNELGCVATEFQVGRDEAKGRVDFFFNYRNTSFLLELKVARIGLGGDAGDGEEGEEADPKKRVTNPWLKGVVKQLKDLGIDTLSACLHRKVVKLPMVIYLYVDWRKTGPRQEWEQSAAAAHQCIVNDLAECPPEFEYFTVFEQPVRTRRRSSGLGDKANMSLYGFSLVAGAARSCLEKEAHPD